MQISKIRWTVKVFNKLAEFLFSFSFCTFTEWSLPMTTWWLLKAHWVSRIGVQFVFKVTVSVADAVLSNISLFCFWVFFLHLCFFLPPYILDCILSFQLRRLQSVYCSSTHERTDALSHGSAVELMEDDLIMDVLRKRAEETDVSTDSYPIPSFHL